MNRSGKILVVAVFLISLCGVASHRTYARFSAITSNVGSLLTASSSPPCIAGGQTVTADADSYVYSVTGSTGTNYGTANPIVIQSYTGNQNKRVFVHFALPTVPALCALTSAELRLFYSTRVTGRTLNAFSATAAWTEGGVTWSNQPAMSGTAATASTTGGTGTYFAFTVLTHVQAFYSGTNTGLIVKDLTENAVAGSALTQNVYSREDATAGNRPQLVLTWA
jgi:hypothetical protein